MNNKINIDIVTATNGSGLWSSTSKKNLILEKMCLCNVLKSNTTLGSVSFIAELRAFFNPKDWDVNTCGLIYTDKCWLKTFRLGLKAIGFSQKAVNTIHYSEQGMQGDNYVSLDVGSDFIKEFAIQLAFGKIEEI